MINKERLEELIKKEAMIYNAEPYNRLTGVPTTRVIKLNKDNYIDCCDNLINKIVIEKVYFEKEYREMAYNEIINIQYLFETKAETDFYEKYKNIIRTETLDLPTFKEVVEKEYATTIIEFIVEVKHTNKDTAIKYRLLKYRHFNNTDKDFIALIGYPLIYGNCAESVDYYKNELTYKNYIEACELCKKLFKEEEV